MTDSPWALAAAVLFAAVVVVATVRFVWRAVGKW